MKTDRDNTQKMTERRLYRDPGRGPLFGVCAGIADYFGFDPTGTRVVAILSLIFFMPATLLVYFGLVVLLPKRSELAVDDTFSELEREVRASPQGTLSSLRHRFRELDVRLQRMEQYVTSPRFGLDREFRDLDSRGER